MEVTATDKADELRNGSEKPRIEEEAMADAILTVAPKDQMSMGGPSSSER